MKLWFAIPFGIAVLSWPLVAGWFILSSIALVVLFGGIVLVRAASADTHPTGGDSTEIEAPASLSGAVLAEQTPNTGQGTSHG